jgi:hypothetical protein
MTKVKYLVATQVVFFCFNYPSYYEVIDWMMQHPKNHCTKDHLLEKIEYFLDKYSPAEAWLRFYCDLDLDMREVFVDYICEVYAKRNMKRNPEDYERMLHAN